jgi:hypothetical protein
MVAKIRILPGIVCLFLVAASGPTLADDLQGIRDELTGKSDEVIRNDLRQLGFPNGVVRSRGRVARVSLRIDGRAAELEVDRFDGSIRIVSASPEARRIIENRIRVPGVGDLGRNASPGNSQRVGPPCMTSVQGRVAWNEAGSMDWPADLLGTLCADARDSEEPGRCFDKVMRGDINWGGGTRWQPSNAARLCSGSHDSEATIGCFERGIKAGVGWQAAIDRCN